MIESITDRVNGDAALVRRGRHVDLAFLIGVGDDDYIVEVAAGRVVSARKRALAATTGCFTIRAAPAVWEEFWRAVPKPGYHDLFAMLAAGLARIDGEILPLMQNLQYFKDVLGGRPRGRAEGRPSSSPSSGAASP